MAARQVVMHKSFRFKSLNLRRRKLGISCSALARKSGVSLATVQRILSGRESRPSFYHVLAIAEVLGFELSEKATVQDLLNRQAKAKAVHLVEMVQGTSGLEGQAIDQDTLEEMKDRTVHELLAGSRRKLWGD